jgi:hypothetical protein
MHGFNPTVHPWCDKACICSNICALLIGNLFLNKYPGRLELAQHICFPIPRKPNKQGTLAENPDILNYQFMTLYYVF